MPLFWRQRLFGSQLKHSYCLIRSFDVSATSTNRRIAVISHTVIRCDKENHNYSVCKLHRMLTRLLLMWFLGTPVNLWTQRHRNSQRGRERWWLPGASKALRGVATCLLSLWRPGAEHRRGSPYTSRFLHPALFSVPLLEGHRWFTITQQFRRGKREVLLMKKASLWKQLAPNCVHPLFLKKQGLKFVPPFSWVVVQVVNSQSFSSYDSGKLCCTISAVKYYYTF